MTANNLKHLCKLLTRLGYECHTAAVSVRSPLHGVQYRHQLTVRSQNEPPAGKSRASITLYLMAWGGVRIESVYARLPALGLPADADPYRVVAKLLDKLDEDERYRRAIGD